MNSPRYRFLAVLSLAALLVACGGGSGDPARTFESVTGRELPPGVSAVAYRTHRNDNLFHVGHYWLLEGSPEALRNFTHGTGLEASPDAGHMFGVAPGLFGLQLTGQDVVKGYEEEAARDNWYWIFAGGREAIYEYNGPPSPGA